MSFIDDVSKQESAKASLFPYVRSFTNIVRVIVFIRCEMIFFTLAPHQQLQLEES